ncbi:MAG: creatininase family protein [Armatimonadota bacterium]
MVTVFNTSKEIADAAPSIAILPVGSLEQHGHHLPIATDTINADEMGRRLAQRLGNCYLLPALPYANSQEHMDLPGTITLRPSTLALVIEDIVLSLRHHGIRRIVIFSTHGGNWVLKPTIRDLNFRYPDIRIIHADGPLPSRNEDTPIETHAGAGETAGMLALHPELVKGRSPDFAPKLGQEWNDYVGYGTSTQTGTWGRPSQADPQAWLARVDELIEHRAAYIQETFARLDEMLAPPGGAATDTPGCAGAP